MSKVGVKNYAHYAVDKLLSLQDQTLFWSSPDEWVDISGRNKGQHSLKYGAGIVDGAHLLLANKAEHLGEEFFTRKGQYDISTVIPVDGKKCICYASTVSEAV
jgi:hypothetical protein